MKRLTFNFNKNTTNYHDRSNGKDGATIHGPKFRIVDLLAPMLRQGLKTRAKWYKRFILYFPSGAWWNLDVAVVIPIAESSDAH